MISDRQTYVKNLIESSAVPILTERINSLQTTVHNLQTLMFKLERDFQTYINVTKDLAEEVSKHLSVRSAHRAYINVAGKPRYYRDFQSVKKRWETWKKLLVTDGLSIPEVARQFGVSYEAVKHAIRKNFVAKSTANKPVRPKNRLVGRLGGRVNPSPCLSIPDRT